MIHSSHYQNPGQLPDGGVLVVGAGPIIIGQACAFAFW